MTMHRLFPAFFAIFLALNPAATAGVVTIEYLVLGTFVAMSVGEGATAEKLEFACESWSWGSRRTSTTGGGVDMGRTDHQDFTLIKSFDLASSRLLELACASAEISAMTVTTTIQYTEATGEVGQYNFIVEIAGVRIANYKTAASSGDIPPVEEITLNYDGVGIIHRRIGAGGEIVEESSAFCLGDGSVRPSQ